MGWALAFAAVTLAPLHLWAQGKPGADEYVPAVLTTFTARVMPRDARRGEHVRLEVTASIAEGWHIYSLLTQGEYAPPPTRVQVLGSNLKPEGPVYETNPLQTHDSVFNMDLAYHERAVRLYKNLRVPDSEPIGGEMVLAEVQFQVCNSRFCTPPRKEQLAAPLTVQSGPVRPEFAYMLRTIDYVDGQGRIQSNVETMDSVLAGGTTAFMVLAVGFGLLSLLTPCVFPMIPVTVTFFTSSARSGGHSVGLAVLFGLGIIGAYTGLGLLLTLVLGAGGVGEFATNPWVNLSVGGFFFLFALSLMGLLNISLPSGWVQALSHASSSLRGPAGVLMMGVAFTAANFTCTAPFVGTLLLAASQGQVVWPLMGMLVFSTTFSLPFFLLALFPRLLIRLQGKAGNWLLQIKVVLGLIEVMAALKFISNADLAWHWGIFTRGTVLALWSGLAMASALLLLGRLRFPGVEVVRRGRKRFAAAGAFFAVAVYLALGAGGMELDAYTEAYLPPSPFRGTMAAIATSDDPHQQLPWQPTLTEALRVAAKQHKPLFIDFTGYTCVNCRWMEKKIFVHPDVLPVLRERFVLAQLYTDGGPYGEVNQQLQIQRFRTVALPYYVILAPDNAVLATHAGIMPSPADFVGFLLRSASGGAVGLEPDPVPKG